ncbi:MAG: glycogen debranching protein GlgX, partial [Pseudohongiellaceae bacterium]
MTRNYPIRPGSIHRLGSIADADGVNFALFSAHAERVDLCIFSADGKHEEFRLTLPDVTNQVWNGYVEGLSAGTRYGYRVYGPYQPDLGHRFNHNKLLLDPYARQLSGEFTWTDLHYAFQLDSPEADLSFDTHDNALYLPKCVVTPPQPERVPRHNRIPKRDTVLYEAHVKGLSMQHPEVPARVRGSFLGVGHAALIRHLQQLGITSLELLPVQGFLSEHMLVEKGLRNYWGYNTLSFFAPHQAYLCGDDIGEFRQMVDALHDAGIEVILDVAFNHTAEGGRLGPTFSFRGIDNLSYYRLQNENRRYYINDSGCGNTLNLGNPFVIQMVMDSLRYWVAVMGVDGFRFDLATVLAREHYGYDRGSGFLDALHQDPTLSAVKLIAEPWDIGPGGYQLGNFPPGWSEWNDRYRDTVRRYWRGDNGMLPDFARRLHGSSDVFEHAGRKPSASINFVTSHDGFTLNDLVSYADRHNEANLEENRDGHAENFSENYGVEGPTLIYEINEVRKRQRRNLLATLLVSQGTPMLQMGDELGRTQQGNNNAYCQDNPLGWVDWDLDEDRRNLLAFSCNLLALRRKHGCFWQDRYIHEGDALGQGIHWLNPAGGIMQPMHWGQHHARALGYLIEHTAPEGRYWLLTLFNAGSSPISFRLPARKTGCSDWQLLLDTSLADGVSGISQKPV